MGVFVRQEYPHYDIRWARYRFGPLYSQTRTYKAALENKISAYTNFEKGSVDG